MLIVALQDDVGELYAIWNTVTDNFLGVNLGKNEAAGIVMDYKNCPYSEALDRVEHPQPFSDISKHIINGCLDEKVLDDLMLALEKDKKYDKLLSSSSKTKSEILLDMCCEYKARIALFLNGHEIPNVHEIISAAEVGNKKQLVVVFEADELKIRDIDGKIKEY